MTLHQINFEETKQFSSIFLDYIHHKQELNKYFTDLPARESFVKAISNRNFDDNKRDVLVETLKDQYNTLSTHEAVTNNIDLLRQKNTFTITTGHQLNIFTGPLFFIYKIVAVINMAKILKATHPAYNFIPVYWMASEDHDFEEINNFRLFGQKYIWETDQKGPVGRLETKSMQNLLEKINESPDFCTKGYADHANLSEATRYIVNHIFSKHGLVILDSDDKRLKKEFIPIIKDDIFLNHGHQLAQGASRQLEEMGYKSQIFPRPINFFFMENGFRERIEELDRKYTVLNTTHSFSKKELESMIDDHPEKFSPNVVLRPVYQEVILPNLAYVGGPAEVAYWLQLKGVFDHYQVPFPLLFPRLFAMIISKANAKKIAKLQLSEKDLFEDFTLLKEKLLFGEDDATHDLSNELLEVKKTFESIRQKAVELDKSLEGFVLSEYKKIEKGIDNIQKRLKKAEEQREEVKINQLKNVLEKLFPNGNPQEREDNFLNFYINNPTFIDELIALLDPFILKYNILTEDA